MLVRFTCFLSLLDATPLCDMRSVLNQIENDNLYMLLTCIDVFL